MQRVNSNVAREVATSVGLMVGGTLIIVWSLAHRGSPAGLIDPLGPFGVARITAGMMVLSGLGLLIIMLVKRRGGTVTAAAQVLVIEDKGQPDGQKEGSRRAQGIVAIVLLLAYISVMEVLGFLASSVLFGLALLFVLGVRRPIPLVAGGLAAGGSIYWLFAVILGVRLP